MNKLLIPLLVMLPFFSQASDLYKTVEDSLICTNHNVLSDIIEASKSDSRETVINMIALALEKDVCAFSKPNIIVRLLDFNGHLYFVEAISHNVTFWVHKSDLVN